MASNTPFPPRSSVGFGRGAIASGSQQPQQSHTLGAAAAQQQRERERVERERLERERLEREKASQQVQFGDLSEEQREEVQEAFNLFDMDRDGHLDYHELKVAMKALGFDLPKNEIQQILTTRGIPTQNLKTSSKVPQTAPPSLVGTNKLLLPRPTFETLMASMILNRDPRDEILRAFDLFDENRTGKIGLDDLRRVARELGEQLSEEDLAAMIDEFDLDGDGMIDRDEFVGICLG
ncbi:EF-hand [Eremomyces bilateralis CBS 781.70]|uniref:EF-hand n=1 Tax=Eremomyces bilateralis CBS 781.70 TaxID=1392243 RepID=A0A6G1G7B6_9PEZI|nr:EF-hand [Eremomyces bilateralis CBS 781.70]KAF1813826.1 EF-hand [Eremomyces bilateralis CBS 781.70]